MKKTIKILYDKYGSLLRYGFFGVVTVIINLLLYKLFLELNINYIISSIVSYFIASLISYYFNLLFVFKQKLCKFKTELLRLFKYFSVRIGSVFVDTLLLYIAVEWLKGDEFISKILISILIIFITYFFNKKILKKGDYE